MGPIEIDSDYPKSLISRTNEVYVFSIKYRYSDILLKKHKHHLSRLFCCNHTCYCINMVSVTSASHYHSQYQSGSSMYIRGLIPRNFAELAEAVQMGVGLITTCDMHSACSKNVFLSKHMRFDCYSTKTRAPLV